MSNKKIKWSDEDEVYLLKLLSQNVNLDKISKKMKKNEKEIQYKLKKMAIKMLNEKKTKDEIIRTLKFLTEEQINKIIEHNTKKILKKKILNNDLSNELSEIAIQKNNSKNNKLVSSENIDNQKIYLMLIEIKDKLNLLLKISNQNTKNDNSIEIDNSTKNEQNSVKSKNNNPKLNEINKNDNDSSSFISSGNDTDDVLNLIKKRTNEVNAIKSKNYNLLKK